MGEPYIHDECIVLKRIPFRDVDANIILLGRSLGKICVLAKGLSKASSKLSSILNVGNVVTVNLFNGKSGFTLLSASQLSDNQRSFNSYEALLTCMYLCEMVDNGIEPESSQEDIYNLLVNVLKNMDDTNIIEARLYFEWHFLVYSGYASNERAFFRSLCQNNCFENENDCLLQETICDEIYSFLMIQMQGRCCALYLSKLARKNFKEILCMFYKKYFDFKIKSKMMLDEATNHFYS
ncbi:MAG: DNA repair protein RecO [Peptococcaceae bacterium]|nr:DNA repair protein RecO [Peptococcaceae bacterium]